MENDLAYFILESDKTSEGEYIVCIAKRGEAGYRHTSWHWGKDFELAQKLCDQQNAKMGLSPKDAALIIASTLSKKIKMREIELMISESYGGDTGQWWTEYIDIPANTPEDDIEEVAIQAWKKEFNASGRREWIANVSLYSIPEIEEDEEEDEQVD